MASRKIREEIEQLLNNAVWISDNSEGIQYGEIHRTTVLGVKLLKRKSSGQGVCEYGDPEDASSYRRIGLTAGTDGWRHECDRYIHESLIYKAVLADHRRKKEAAILSQACEQGMPTQTTNRRL